VRTRILDRGEDVAVAGVVIDAADEAGYTAEEIIPGLVLAIYLLARKVPDTEGALDEAANLLADGPDD
jgi:hypothetical protein